MNALIGIACGMTSHRELGRDSFDVMGYLCRQGYLAIDIASEADGYQLVRMRSEVFSGNDFPVTHIPIFNNCRVEAETAMVIANCAKPQILNVKGPQWLEVLRVGTLHV